MKIKPKKEKKLHFFLDKCNTLDFQLRRLIFALTTIPTIFNLLVYALIIKDIRGILFGCAAIAAVYFILVFFIEIKAGEWSVFALVGNAAVSILISIFFPLAYKLYLWFIVIALEIVGMILLYIFRGAILKKIEK